MKKIVITIFTLGMFFSTTSAVRPDYFCGFVVYKVDCYLQPPLSLMYDWYWYDENASFYAADGYEFDLEYLADPTPGEWGDELCEPSTQLCLVQFKLNWGEVDPFYGTNGATLYMGSLLQPW
ncbi:MAG TPA: hypothetical protein VD993_01750 [Chitinophagaceae bacterium]|nr:hypothetical protein [Chitinophagaceae bacterium]